jgi:hypothetical protein
LIFEVPDFGPKMETVQFDITLLCLIIRTAKIADTRQNILNFKKGEKSNGKRNFIGSEYFLRALCDEY